MKASELLHYAFRARDPESLGRFYAATFEGQFFLHPVMTGLGIIIVKLNHPEALFHGLLEFWPWDVVWDSEAAVFRRVTPRPSPTSYGHLALRIAASADEIVSELNRRSIIYRLEPRGPGLLIPTIDDPEGNMIELFPNIDHLEVPAQTICPPPHASEAIAAIRQRFLAAAAHHPAEQGYPLNFL